MTDTETPMRERIKAALDRFHRNSCYPDAMDFELDAAADAVLDAMREPTGNMREAGARSYGIPTPAIGSLPLSVIDGQPSKAWRAMIDAAKEGK